MCHGFRSVFLPLSTKLTFPPFYFPLFAFSNRVIRLCNGSVWGSGACTAYHCAIYHPVLHLPSTSPQDTRYAKVIIWVCSRPGFFLFHNHLQCRSTFLAVLQCWVLLLPDNVGWSILMCWMNFITTEKCGFTGLWENIASLISKPNNTNIIQWR